MARATYLEIMLVNEEHSTPTKYMKFVSTKGTKQSTKLRLRKYDPILKGHFWFVQKKMPSHNAK